MQSNNHHAIIKGQFDARADAYLTSAVHASGEDLEQMARLIGLRPDAIALDMGCGGGHAAYRLAPLVKQVVACDLSAPMLEVVASEAARRGLHNVSTDRAAAESLPFADASFDVVVSRYSVHHWHNVPAGLAQMRRVLKPGAIAVFMDVVSPGVPLTDTWLQSLELLRDPSHVRDASLAEWHGALAAAGFTPGQTHTYRLRLEFASWIERMKTPPAQVQAIRALQHCAGTAVSEYFEFEADGSFTVDTMLIAAGV